MYSNLYFAIVGCWCVDLSSLRNFGRDFVFVFNLLTGKVQLRAAPLAGQVPVGGSRKIKRAKSSVIWPQSSFGNHGAHGENGDCAARRLLKNCPFTESGSSLGEAGTTNPGKCRLRCVAPGFLVSCFKLSGVFQHAPRRLGPCADSHPPCSP